MHPQVRALEVDRFTAEEPGEHREALVETGPALRHRFAVRGVVDVGAQSHAEYRATAGQVVERDDLSRDDLRTAARERVIIGPSTTLDVAVAAAARHMYGSAIGGVPPQFGSHVTWSQRKKPSQPAASASAAICITTRGSDQSAKGGNVTP